MNESEKAYYKEKAKSGEVKVPRPGKGGGDVGNGGNGEHERYTTHGIPVSVYDREKRDQEQATENMRRRVGRMIQKTDLMKGTFSWNVKHQNQNLLIAILWILFICSI